MRDVAVGFVVEGAATVLRGCCSVVDRCGLSVE